MNQAQAVVGPAAWLDRPADASWYFPAEGGDFRTSDLRRRAMAIAAALSARGVRSGDKVAVIQDNGSSMLCVLLALWHLGSVPVPLRPSGSGAWLDEYLGDIRRLCDVCLVIDDAVAAGMLEASPAGVAPEPHRARDDDLALIQFSSGSTGRPKGVMVTHGMIAAQVRQLKSNYEQAGKGESPRAIASWLPFYHDMGLFIGILLPLYLGCDVMAAPPAYYMRNPARWFRAMARRRDDATFFTNSVLAATLRGLRRMEIGTCDLSGLIIYLAAEKIGPAVLDEMMAVLGPHGLAETNIRAGYGLAEYALGCTSTPGGRIRRVSVTFGPDGRVRPAPTEQALTLVSAGVPNEGCEIAIRSTGGRVLGEMVLGEITVSGPCLTPGYYNDPEATRRAMGQSYLRTGDLGFLFAGELYFYARADEMLIVGGRNISPGDVEWAVEQLPFVGPGRCVLFGVDDARSGVQSQVLLVECRDVLAPEIVSERLILLRRLVLDQFGFTPSHIRFVAKGTVEKTSSGKKRTAVIRARYLNGEIASPHGP
jgi:acyl-CoA synthetase (AMP-forming)/AMP-acid ligase II